MPPCIDGTLFEDTSAGLAPGQAMCVDERCSVLQRLTYLGLGYAMPVGKLLDRCCIETRGLNKVQGFGLSIQPPRDGRNTQQ